MVWESIKLLKENFDLRTITSPGKVSGLLLLIALGIAAWYFDNYRKSRRYFVCNTIQPNRSFIEAECFDKYGQEYGDRFPPEAFVAFWLILVVLLLVYTVYASRHVLFVEDHKKDLHQMSQDKRKKMENSCSVFVSCMIQLVLRVIALVVFTILQLTLRPTSFPATYKCPLKSPVDCKEHFYKQNRVLNWVNLGFSAIVLIASLIELKFLITKCKCCSNRPRYRNLQFICILLNVEEAEPPEVIGLNGHTGPSTMNPSRPNASLPDSATDPQSTWDSGYNSLPPRNFSSSINNKPLAERTTSNPTEYSTFPYDSRPRIVSGNRSMSYDSLHTNQASGYTVEHLTHKLDCMDTLSRLLDTEYVFSRHVKYWKHLADDLGMPKDLIERISRISKRSPSEDLFKYLFAAMPHLTLLQFMDALASKGRNDVKQVLKRYVDEKPGLDIHEPFHKLRKQTPEVLSNMALKLDQGAIDYEQIADALGISQEIVQQLGRNSSYNPTGDILFQLKSKYPWTTNAMFKKKLQDSNRPVAMKLLNNFSDESTIEEIFDDLETMSEFCNQFNAEIPGTWNYRNLAAAFKLKLDNFTPKPHNSLSSPTKEVFEWLKCDRPNEPVDSVLISIARIERNDVLKALHKFIPEGYVVNVLQNQFQNQWIRDHHKKDNNEVKKHFNSLDDASDIRTPNVQVKLHCCRGAVDESSSIETKRINHQVIQTFTEKSGTEYHKRDGKEDHQPSCSEDHHSSGADDHQSSDTEDHRNKCYRTSPTRW